VLIVLGPALGWGLGRAVRRGTRRPARRPAARRLSARTVEIELDLLLTGLAPAAVVSGEDSDLAAALRAAGLEPEVVRRLLALRTMLRERRYAPSQDGHDDLIVARWDELHSQLAGGGRRRRVSHGLLNGLVLSLSISPAVAAQEQSAEALYESGALGAARAAFAARAGAQPDIAAHWYNLGAADYRLGDAVQASAEWRRAVRLDPRNPGIRQALQLTPAPDAVSARRLWTAPFTPSESALVAVLLWSVAWVGFFLRPTRAARWLSIGTAALLCGGAALWLGTRYAKPVALVRESVPIRVSPHGRASVLATLDEGQAVLPLGGQRGWLLVRDPGDRLGWIPAVAVVPVDPQ
jgi:tetratricopeptide (TPR) repeat protein